MRPCSVPTIAREALRHPSGRATADMPAKDTPGALAAAVAR